jgi:phage portal protein BeeE
VGLLDRISAARSGGRDENRYSVDDYLSDAINTFAYGGNQYQFGLNTTYAGQKLQEVAQSLPGYMNVLRQSPPAFTAQMVRGLVLSQARFVFRNRATSRSPRRTFGTTALAPLENPWPRATTGELLSRMEWSAGLAGNAYVHRRESRLRVLRPDWVAILYGSDLEPDDPMHAIDGEVIGYLYRSGGIVGGSGQLTSLNVEDIAHWSPIPDPESPELGMSWLTPAIRDMQSDKSATEHKLKYFTNGATPNLVVKGIPAANKRQFDEIVEMLEERHTGIANAYRTLYLTTGADATVVGSNLQEIDFKSVQASGETRIASLSRVPAQLLGISEGLAGSSLNQGNFIAARRIFADTWVYPNLQDLCASLAPLVKVPSDSELWFDAGDIPLLREDGKDAADIQATKAQTIRQLLDAGYLPDSVIAAVRADDMSLLKHSGLFSVQLQPPGSVTSPATSIAPTGQE